MPIAFEVDHTTRRVMVTEGDAWLGFAHSIAAAAHALTRACGSDAVTRRGR